MMMAYPVTCKKRRFVGVAILLFSCIAIIMAGETRADTDTNSWLNSTMLKLDAMDFDFSRSDSDVPFQPVLSLGYKVYGESEFHRSEGDLDVSGSFRTRSSYAFAMTPLYIGQRGFAIAVPYIGYTRFHFTEGDAGDESVTSVYLPLGAIWQTESGNQWGVFAMPSTYSPLRGDGDWAWSGMGGILGRHFSSERLVWYYGLVYDYGFSDGYFLPYAGFTYTYDPSWTISMIAPWPGINYAPNDHFFVRLGVAPSGASWAVEKHGDDEQAITSFGGWDLGVWANWRLTKAMWFAVGSGISGLRSLEIDTDGDASFDQETDNEPWVSISFSIRPQ
jgi:hypothetical protein